jgi:hypothetical protein
VDVTQTRRLLTIIDRLEQRSNHLKGESKTAAEEHASAAQVWVLAMATHTHTHTYICVYMWYLYGILCKKSPDIRSCTLYKYGPGRPYPVVSVASSSRADLKTIPTSSEHLKSTSSTHRIMTKNNENQQVRGQRHLFCVCLYAPFMSTFAGAWCAVVDG